MAFGVVDLNVAFGREVTLPLLRSSPNKTPGSRPIIISSNALIQAAARNSRMFKAMGPELAGLDSRSRTL
uniref:Uncharacterized protein n=1 Tax=Aegilops tauschii TaxID=37682 RepID=M8C227_AEGTA